MNNILLVGAGKFGQKYISTIANISNIDLTIASKNTWKHLIDAKPDGVMVCTPPQSHIEIASYALERCVPVMVEKPLALSLQECKQLKKYNTPILVNHIHLFSDTYQKIKQNISVEKIKLIKSIGSSNSPPRDYSRLWDYGPHEISMILDLTQQYPNTIQCVENSNCQFNIKMNFNTFTSDSVVGLSETRQRYFDVDGKYIYDGMKKEFPLTNAIKVFINNINGINDYRIGLDLSFKVMEILEKCQESIDTKSIITN